jgi:hypothetical protein
MRLPSKWIMLVAVSFFILSLGFMVLAQGSKFALRVDAGNFSAYTDKAGNVWQGEKEYVKGKGFGFVGGDYVDRGGDLKIEGTPDPKIYQTEHYSMTAFVAEVPNGQYTVRLHYAETFEDIDQVGPRVFDVSIQKKVVHSDLNVQKAAGGLQKALVQEFKGIEVADGILEIAFVAKEQNPEINGLEILAE